MAHSDSSTGGVVGGRGHADRYEAGSALVYGGDPVILTGHAALGVHGFARSASMNDVHLLVPAAYRRLPKSFVIAERTTRMPEALHRNGMPVAPVVRAVLDASRRMNDPRLCEALLAEVIQRGDAAIAELVKELELGSNHGSAVPRLVLKELGDGAQSVAEADARKVHRQAGLPPMLHNRDIVDADSKFIARPDGWIDSVALAWEIDSFAYHSSPKAFEETLARRQRMQNNRIVVVAHAPRQLRTDPQQVIDDLREGYRQAAARPRPNVRVA